MDLGTGQIAPSCTALRGSTLSQGAPGVRLKTPPRDFSNQKPGQDVSPQGMEIIVTTLKSKTRDRLPREAFAEPEKRAYPVEDKLHARNAKARANQAVKAGRMSRAEEAKIDERADAVLGKG